MESELEITKVKVKINYVRAIVMATTVRAYTLKKVAVLICLILCKALTQEMMLRFIKMK